MKFLKNNYKAKKFLWQGYTHEGYKANGIINAPTKNIAIATLFKQHIPKVTFIANYSVFIRHKYKKVSSRILSVFMRQLATLINTGIPLIQSCEILQRTKHGLALNYILSILKMDLLEGRSVVHSLAKFPEYFNAYTCALIQAGVQSGTFAIMLNRIAYCKEQNEILKRKIKQALLYPCLILAIAGIVCTILLIVVIPRFVALFDSMHSDLPWLTQCVVSLSNLIRGFGIYAVIAIVAIIYFSRNVRMPAAVLLKFAQWRYQIPLLGPIFLKNIMMHFARNLATTTSAGLPMLEALSLIAPTLDDKIYTSIVQNLRQELQTGCGFNEALTRYHFPHLLIQMAKIGEESGNLADMLDRVANMYESEVDFFLNNLSQFLEPLIMALLGVLIGGLVIAMYLPIFKIGTIL